MMRPPPRLPTHLQGPEVIDAGVLATRAIGRRLDGDHAGALQDLRAALDLERDPARCGSIEQLLRMPETTR